MQLRTRIPEPELMDDMEQAQAYSDADFTESHQRFVDEFVARFRVGSSGPFERSTSGVDLRT